MSEAQRLKALEDEGRGLKLLVAELSLHGEALKGVIRKKGWSLPVYEAMWRTLGANMV